MSFKEELEKTLHQYMQKHGNTISQWKNNDYEYAQTLPEDEQDEIVPELLTSIINLVDREMPKELSMQPAIDTHSDAGAGHVIGYNQAIDDMRNKLRGEIDGN